MRITIQPKWRALSCFIIAGSLSVGSQISQAEDMIEGLAVATSIRGNIQITDSKGLRKELKLHEALSINTSTITTGDDAHIFFALSNGMGVGIGPESKIIVETYLQKPFTEKKEQISYEPSVSILTIRLVTGTIALASNQLSPLSQVRTYLPEGEIRIHSATCVVQSDAMGPCITVSKGTLTYYFPDGETREFIVEPQSIRISPQSAKLGNLSGRTTIDNLPKSVHNFSLSTELASKRVLFKAGRRSTTPQPVLIASPDYFDQPVARPYEFNDTH